MNTENIYFHGIKYLSGYPSYLELKGPCKLVNRKHSILIRLVDMQVSSGLCYSSMEKNHIVPQLASYFQCFY